MNWFKTVYNFGVLYKLRYKKPWIENYKKILEKLVCKVEINIHTGILKLVSQV